MSMKNSNDTIGHRTRDLPTCSAVPQPTAPPRTPSLLVVYVSVCSINTGIYLIGMGYGSVYCGENLDKFYFPLLCTAYTLMM